MTKTEFVAVFQNNLDQLETAFMSVKPSQCIYMWPENFLAVRFDRDNCRAVAANMATIVSKNDRRTFTNGHGQRAVLMFREQALKLALTNARKILAGMETA